MPVKFSSLLAAVFTALCGTTCYAQPRVTCHNFCYNVTGCDTQQQICTDNYCVIVRTAFQNGSVSIDRGCSSVQSLQYDSGLQNFTVLDTCQRIVYARTEYWLKICSNADYCNHACIPAQDGVPVPLTGAVGGVAAVTSNVMLLVLVTILMLLTP
ncbi:hypothetical protein AAVH_02017 [Aphelenchoides avenae]|nr:hypothetical protein AAVH_02017 [Aphelenchus avenae]